jgi:hypothetical protein
VVTKKMAVFFYVMPCSLVGRGHVTWRHMPHARVCCVCVSPFMFVPRHAIKDWWKLRVNSRIGKSEKNRW